MKATVAALGSQQQIDDIDTMRTRILDAALACFAADGVRRTTMNAIAGGAGVGVATVYRRFPQKEQLVNAVLLRESSLLIAAVQNAVDEADTAEDQLVAGFATFTTEITNRGLLREILDSDRGTGGIDHSENGSPLLELGRGFLSGIIRRWQTDRTIADFDADLVAEIFARLAYSLALTPQGLIPLADTDSARRFARIHLIPLLHPNLPDPS
ncbi:TetR/AcrR family transcriptional regulator [Nocardia sp. NPDC005978]|uniref:TetR/AcrR family transcriptional regulator n=1 Tax=Nocardia sp. NPDC005978 TaxID=3156725 RepID=UPI0033A95C25